MYPGITVKFATYTEGDLRAAIEKDVATHSNAFNVIMIGPYETPLFAKNGWLDNLSTQYIASDPSYDAGDLLPPISKALSYNGSLYAVPFYGESSMLFYRKDLFKAAGLTMPAHPTWTPGGDLRGQAQQARQDGGDLPARRGGLGREHGRPGHRGQHLRRRVVQHELAAPAHLAGVREGDQLLRQPGPQVRRAGRVQRRLHRVLTLYGQGKCAMWYDATVAATSITGSFPSVAAQTGYAFAPTDLTSPPGGCTPGRWASRRAPANAGAAWKFVSWATSKQYDSLVASKYGWAAVPPGTRTSLYSNPDYLSAAKAFAPITLASIDSTDPDHPTVNPVPYVGIQYVDIPQFESLGVTVGQQIAGAIAGTESVSQALQASPVRRLRVHPRRRGTVPAVSAHLTGPREGPHPTGPRRSCHVLQEGISVTGT